MSAGSVAIIGAGIVGLATAFYLTERGVAVTLIDPAPEGDKASFGNAASFAVSECVPAGLPGVWRALPGWLLRPDGPLYLRPASLPALLPWLWGFARAARPHRVAGIAAALAALNEQALAAAAPIFDATRYGNRIHHAGALTLYNDRAAFEADRLSWDIRARHGIGHEVLEDDALWAAEPALSPVKRFGVRMRAWSHIDDPKDLHARLYAHLVTRGVTVVAARATGLAPHADGVTCHLAGQASVQADHAVVAAGAFSAALARSVGDRVLLTSERGYNATLPNPGFTPRAPLIFAAEKTVAVPVAGGLRIGGAAEFAGLDAPTNATRSDALVRAVCPIFKTLDTTGMTRWMGQRPATPDSLPVIGRSPRAPRVVYAFGHGHLGLTQGPITGRLVADVILDRDVPVDLAPFSIARFASGRDSPRATQTPKEAAR